MLFKALHDLRRYKVLIWRVKDSFREIFRRHTVTTAVGRKLRQKTEPATWASRVLPRELERLAS